MTWCLAALAWCTLSVSAQAQGKFFTKNGEISFYSKATLERIEAVNKKVTSVLDTESGKLEFSLLMNAFMFEKALMQEHFNENYVESEKFPKSTFKGKVSDISAVNFGKDGSYNVTVSGDLTIHGVTKPVSAKGVIKVAAGKVSAKSTFNIALADYKVQIPAVVKDNISPNIEIRVSMNYQPLNNDK
ncbi:MAG: YceI family protein [Sphingobacteriales bacterium]|nr:YceI family protein [Sphingobacteriales bacterium]